jgi:hypothetical protein
MRSALTLVVLLIATTSMAQTPTSYIAKYYAVGGTQPLQSDTFLASAAVCNQAAMTTTNTVNPDKIVFPDLANPGRFCVYTTPPTAQIRSLPVGANYEGTLTVVNGTGPGAESARSPFSRLSLPNAPVGVIFTR